MDADTTTSPTPHLLPLTSTMAHSRRYAFDVRIPSVQTYEVCYESGILDRYGEVFAQRFGTRRAIVLTDERVQELYGCRLQAAFACAGRQPDVLTVPAGEGSKSLSTYTQLLGRLTALETDRRAVLVAFGGGVITDLGGFVASTYMRGIDYTNVSTTLLGQIDACVGGKVAVNSPQAKNLYGAFHHPAQVVGDPMLLQSLDPRDVRSGLAEGIKVAMLGSTELFDRLERQADAVLALQPDVLAPVIGEAARIKLDILAADPYEADLRRPLNLGHTIAHPIETHAGYQDIRHGEAVAIGLAVATLIARRRRLLDGADAARILDLLRRYDLLASPVPLDVERILGHVDSIRLVRAGNLHYVLPKTIGEVIVTDDVSHADLRAGLLEYARLTEEPRP